MVIVLLKLELSTSCKPNYTLNFVTLDIDRLVMHSDAYRSQYWLFFVPTNDEEDINSYVQGANNKDTMNANIIG